MTRRRLRDELAAARRAPDVPATDRRPGLDHPLGVAIGCLVAIAVELALALLILALLIVALGRLP